MKKGEGEAKIEAICKSCNEVVKKGKGSENMRLTEVREGIFFSIIKDEK